MKDSQIAGHMVFYYMKGLYHPLSGVCHITERKRKGKGLEQCDLQKTKHLIETQYLFLL